MPKTRHKFKNTPKEVHFSPEQQAAIAQTCDMNLRIHSVTGGAGTGKTSVLGEAHAELKRGLAADKIALVAPTGRAAKRIQELTGIQAQTIHRLLEFPQPDDPEFDDDGNRIEVEPNKPRRNRMRPLEQRVVIVDEASMLAPSLYAQLMDALPNNGCIRFFGDNNQLPPVERGTPPFVTLLKQQSKTELTFNFRSEDAIVGNSLRILRGSIPERNDRFEIVYSDEPIREAIRLVTHDFAREDHQIIMPTRNGSFGTLALNPRIQLKLNPEGAMLPLPRHPFEHREDKDSPAAPPDLPVRVGDKFLWIKNDYKLDMFNGEIGTIDAVHVHDGSLDVSTDAKAVHVPPFVRVYSPVHGHIIHYDPRKNLELGYAVTTHKAQGSEFETIIYCMTSQAGYLLGRRNFYTAVTRAKHRVIIVCNRRAMTLSVQKESRAEKYG